jgi:hypothetical protein
MLCRTVQLLSVRTMEPHVRCRFRRIVAFRQPLVTAFIHSADKRAVYIVVSFTRTYNEPDATTPADFEAPPGPVSQEVLLNAQISHYSNGTSPAAQWREMDRVP